jgi:hypothetical protein
VAHLRRNDIGNEREQCFVSHVIFVFASWGISFLSGYLHSGESLTVEFADPCGEFAWHDEFGPSAMPQAASLQGKKMASPVELH